MELITVEGERLWLETHPDGGEEDGGYDLRGAVIGCEGMFGIVTQVLVRLLPVPETCKTFLAVFETVNDASQTVSDIIEAGIIPGAMEMMDQLIIQVVEAAYHFGFPLNAGAVLIVELDGLNAATSRRYSLRIPNVFHAGDGNIHPLALYDERDPKQVQRALAASRDILNKCIELGGSVSGEHGIGVEKIDFMAKQFSKADLDTMKRLRVVFDPQQRCNPHKMFLSAKHCSDFILKKQIPA